MFDFWVLLYRLQVYHTNDTGVPCLWFLPHLKNWYLVSSTADWAEDDVIYRVLSPLCFLEILKVAT